MTTAGHVALHVPAPNTSDRRRTSHLPSTRNTIARIDASPRYAPATALSAATACLRAWSNIDVLDASDLNFRPLNSSTHRRHGLKGDPQYAMSGPSPALAIGEFVTANSTGNRDLFWALRAGGGGTFGVVTSVTIKVYKDMPMSAASWTLDSSRMGKDQFWAATKAFFERAIDNVDAGAYSYLLLVPTGKDFALIMQPFFAPNKTANQLNNILAPYLSRLTALNIPFSPRMTEYKGFYSAWQAEFPLEPQSSALSVVSSRLFPRSNFASETGRNVTFNVIRQTVEAGQMLIAFNMATRGCNPDNAVNPAWRNSVYHIITGISVNHKSSPADIMAARATLTNGTMQKWRDVTPESGAYLNEADRLEPNWQQSF